MIKGVRKLKRNMSGERQDLVFGSRLSAINEVVEAINKRLEELLPESGSTPQLRNAMAYSLLAPGKRLRPLLTIFSSMHFGFRDLTAHVHGHQRVVSKETSCPAFARRPPKKPPTPPDPIIAIFMRAL